MIKNKRDNQTLLIEETLYSTANGYIGIRGNFEEGYCDDYNTIRGSYINGFYDTVDINYGESAHGFPQTAQKILNTIDAQTIQIYIEGDLFTIFTGELLSYERRLDIVNGYAVREVEWISPKGHHLKIQIKRMTSFEQLELMTIEYRIEALNFSGGIRIFSFIDGDVENYTNPSDPRVASGHVKLLETTVTEAFEDRCIVAAKTQHSNLETAVTVGYDVDMASQTYDTGVISEHYVMLEAGESFDFTKYIIYTDSIRHKDVISEGEKLLKTVMSLGIRYYYKVQKTYLEQFWKYAKINIEGKDSLQEALDYNMYQLLASAGKDPHSNIAAKGLSGEGYEGHYFWDTEIYMLPMFTLTQPEISKNLLRFRYETLDKARLRAKDMGHKKGAKIPWRTISGSECSAYFPAGSAQYHINADVAYAYIQYYLFTGDIEFMKKYGLEVLYETARIWLEIGHFHTDGSYRINAVTGPDEYTAIVNNNYYTNALAGYHLRWTVKIAELIRKIDEDFYGSLSEQIDINDEELSIMKKAAQNMYLPYDQVRGISLQDDALLTRDSWDFENTPKENYPLLLHYHPLTIYRYNVLKQADTVLAHFLLDEESDLVIEASYDFYEPLTTHDSSLSLSVYAMVAARIGRTEEAFSHFEETLRLDLDNLHHNTKDGLHVANAGGNYMAVVYGFAGLRIKEEGLSMRPVLPKGLKSYTFRLNYGGLVTIKVGGSIEITTESPLKVKIFETFYEIEDTLTIPF